MVINDENLIIIKLKVLFIERVFVYGWNCIVNAASRATTQNIYT